MKQNKVPTVYDDETKILFHITDRSNLQNILSKGLHPCIGNNSAICSEKEAKVYLTDFDSIPYWAILLDIANPILLTVSDVNAEKFQYSYYTEYTSREVISSKHISIADQSLLANKTSKYMQILCKEYMICLCAICLWIVRGYTYNKVEEIPFDSISALLSAVNRLDYSCRSEEEWKTVLEDYGADGEYTFCDHYAYTDSHGPKLFEQITLFEEDEHASLRKQIHDTITKLFPSCNDWETGGWTG